MKKIRPEGIKKIVIIGGSHSGFSAAWMLLNGPATLWNNTSINTQAKRIHKEGDPFNFHFGRYFGL